MHEQAPTPSQRFVWWSTEKSVADGIPSVLAVVEVVVAVAAYWAIAIYFETTTHLWVSICVAPLLLMRSEQSVALGARWFHFYLRPLEDLQPAFLPRVYIWCLVAGLIASVLVSSMLAAAWLGGYKEFGWSEVREDLSLYLRCAAVGYAAMTVALAVPFAIVAEEEVGLAAVCAMLTMGALVPAALWTWGGRGAGVPAGMVSAGGLVAAIVDLMSPVGIFTALGFSVGVWLRTIAIRFVATTCFLRTGFWNIPTNFRQTLFVIDLRHPAELIPGYRGNFSTTSTEFIRGFASEGLFSSLFSWIMFVVYFIPAYLYRLSIKSTCWLYLPLVYIAKEQDLAITPAHFVDRVIRGGWELWRRTLALLTLIAFAATTYASISFHEVTGSLTHRAISPDIISPIEFMFQFDFSGKWWQYCSLFGALITGWLFLQAKEMRVDLDHAKEVVRQVDRVKLMMRVRNVLSVALVLMIGVHALLSFSPVALYLPASILRGLGWFYGAYMPPVPTVP
jgi:hypothetical protein